MVVLLYCCPVVLLLSTTTQQCNNTQKRYGSRRPLPHHSSLRFLFPVACGGFGLLVGALTIVIISVLACRATSGRGRGGKKEESAEIKLQQRLQKEQAERDSQVGRRAFAVAVAVISVP